ncbi:hypothetical protein GIB67_001131 [Kingdonia uniflora]|uniref:Cyclin-like domain-containing protein n=1 Tax=Kingdonia uniflora TaxID=39325 RepID=A0A7J7MH39_9MAGN|nr:hypothetical protein GIB67_001131 [Kingdonia uniflora]
MGSISENCLGWAARDTSGVLLPYNFIRRDTGPDHASLTTTHCGICYADVAWAKNIPRNTIYPVVPGHEIVGIVKEVGSNDRRFKVGDHVGVEPYVNSCKTCEHCKIREEVHCDAETTHTFKSVDEDGIITRGGYSSYIVVLEGYVIKIPDNYPLVLAEPLLCAGIIVYAPMMRHKVNKPGKSLGVVGSSGLGHLAVKFCKAFGLHHLNNFLDRSSHDTLSETDVQKGKAWIMQLLAVACLSLAAKMEEIEVPLSVDLQVEECKFIFEAKTIQRMELLVLSTLKWRMRVVTPFTFMDYFFRKNNDDLPPPSSQISRLVELILRLTRGIEYLEFKPSEVAAVVSISVIRETNLDKDFKCLELIHELQRSAAVQSVSQNPIGVLDVSCLGYKSDELPTVLSANSSQADSDFKRVNLNKPFDMD